MRRITLLLLPATFLTTTLLASLCSGQVETVTKARYDLDLSFAVTGKVMRQPIALGTRVKKGDILIQLEDKVGQKTIDRIALTAQSNIPVDTAKARAEQAKHELQLVKDLVENDAANQKELETAQLVATVTMFELEQAKLDKQISRAALAEAQAQHEMFVLRAPVDGIVERVRMDVEVQGQEVVIGEMVQPQVSVVRLVDVSSLTVDALLELGDTLKLKVGGKAWVRSDIPGRTKLLVARIVHISSLTDYGSLTKLVRIEIPNPTRYLEPGWGVTVYVNDPATLSSEQNKAADKERS